MSLFDVKEHAHKRLNILTGEWVLVSPHRTKRPWQGKVEAAATAQRPQYDANCYLCPGNKRADGSVNPAYTEPYAFNNDFAALLGDTPDGEYALGGLLQAKSQKGICRVICFSPRHDLTLPQMQVEEIEKVVALWQKEFTTLAANPWIKYIQIFENKGDIMGCSNPHPHGQIWSLNDVPAELVKETEQQKKYFEKFGKSLLSDYLQLELQQQERIVCANEHFVALVPFWAVWPYETMIISRRQVRHVAEFTKEENIGLAQLLQSLTVRYDNLFSTSFPYSAGIHQMPVNDGDHPEWHWHMHFYPPLLRSATVKKFMVGYEMLASPQRDITPEAAAEKLKALSEVHYTK
ncbi:MAG: UDP-glucose--hexose-1-phosphate uridylyltransferase [Bacteroidota bacterium]|nr:UDP-glucose--hexose-1-phosphate uridylyltransferase [Bacteroidota bacterium]